MISLRVKKRMLIISIIASLLIAFADYLLEFHIGENVSSSIVEESWESMANWRFVVSLNICAFMIPLYLLGIYVLFIELKKTLPRASYIICGLFTYGIIMGSPLIHGVMCINPIIYKFLIDANVSLQSIVRLIEVDITNSVLIVFIFHYAITWIIAPSILFYMIIRGRTVFKRWMVILSPLVCLVIAMLLQLLFKDVGAYLTPGAINKGNALMFFMVYINLRKE